jgi:hypothetical protein
MKLILVCGPWSSGTTAIGAMLHALGLGGFGPFFQTNDPRMSNSFESIAFRRAVSAFATEQPLRRTQDSAEIVTRLKAFKTELETHRTENAVTDDTPTFLKYPLSALAIPEIVSVFDTKLVYVLRPLADIESTRVRRRWPEVYGEMGAKVIYSRMFQFLVDYSIPSLILRYPDVLKAPVNHAGMLARFSGRTEISPALIEASAAAIRSSNPPARPPSHDRV